MFLIELCVCWTFICVDCRCCFRDISCWPGHWYLSQGLAHVESVGIKIYYLLHELCQGERDIINSGGSKPSPGRGIRAVHKATHREQSLFPPTSGGSGGIGYSPKDPLQTPSKRLNFCVLLCSVLKLL